MGVKHVHSPSPATPSEHDPCPLHTCPLTPTGHGLVHVAPANPATQASHRTPAHRPLESLWHRHVPLPVRPSKHTPRPEHDPQGDLSAGHSDRHESPNLPAAQIAHDGPPQYPLVAVNTHEHAITGSAPAGRETVTHVPCPEHTDPARVVGQVAVQFAPVYPSPHIAHASPAHTPVELAADTHEQTAALMSARGPHVPCPLHGSPAGPGHGNWHADPTYDVSHVHTPLPFDPSEHTPCPLHGRDAPPGHSSVQYDP